jgi:hypothetical protein
MKSQEKRVFSFEVDTEGNFTYTPPGDWAYNRTDLIRFETRSGDFTINFIPKPDGESSEYSFLRGPLSAKPESDGIYAVETTVNDALPDKERQQLYIQHLETSKEGYIAKYNYAIALKDKNDRVMFKDDTHNGTYTC